MASEQYKCKEELSILDIEETEIKQIACGSYFGDIHDILKREIIKEEATEVKPISEYGVFNECLAMNENGKDYPIHFWENRNFNGLAGELAKHKVNHFDNGVIMKNEDHSEDSLTSIELKTETPKTENDIDITYEDVKPELCEEKASGKSENETYPNSINDISIGPEPNFSLELSKDSETWPQQDIEESETAVGKDNDTRTEPTINTQIIQKLPHCTYYSKFHPEQEFNEIPHTGEKPFQCKICSKSFNKEGNLTTHKKLHVGKKPFQCKICSKYFNHKRDLTRHEGIHTGEKQYQCTFCAKLFLQQRYLAVHERIHKGEKPYQCKICSKSFKLKNHLLRHEKFHAGAKPFHCRICSEFYSKQLIVDS